MPLTKRLKEALRQNKHLVGPRILNNDDGTKLSVQNLKTWLERAQRKAGLPVTGRLHSLRHTFCSHLVMQGVPLPTVRELAGHSAITTTMRYVHLAKGAKEDAIAKLEGPAPFESRGTPVAKSG